MPDIYSQNITQMSNSALENVISINDFVNEAALRSNRILPSGPFECPDAELGTKCREVCLDEFIACITDCGSEIEEGFHIELWKMEQLRTFTPPIHGLKRGAAERHRVSVNLKTLLSVPVTVRERILIANMHVHVAVDVPMDVQ